MTSPQDHFSAALVREADAALVGLTTRQRVSYAVRLLLNVDDPNACAAMSFAASRVTQHSADLLRKQYEQECG